MIDAYDFKNMISTIIQPNLKFLMIITVIILLASQYLDTNIIYIVSILLFIFVNYKSILGTIDDIKKSESKVERVIEDNKRVTKEIHFSDELNKSLHRLRRFRKYNPQSYDEGYNYMKMFMTIFFQRSMLL